MVFSTSCVPSTVLHGFMHIYHVLTLPHGIDAIIILISQMRKLRHKFSNLHKLHSSRACALKHLTSLSILHSSSGTSQIHTGCDLKSSWKWISSGAIPDFGISLLDSKCRNQELGLPFTLKWHLNVLEILKIKASLEPDQSSLVYLQAGIS